MADLFLKFSIILGSQKFWWRSVSLIKKRRFFLITVILLDFFCELISSVIAKMYKMKVCMWSRSIM